MGDDEVEGGGESGVGDVEGFGIWFVGVFVFGVIFVFIFVFVVIGKWEGGGELG